jgi:hypothetical protein
MGLRGAGAPVGCPYVYVVERDELLSHVHLELLLKPATIIQPEKSCAQAIDALGRFDQTPIIWRRPQSRLPARRFP